MTTPLTLRGDERILVTGASGWLGRALLSRLLPVVDPAKLMAVASRDHLLALEGAALEVAGWDDDAVAEFSPTHIVHLAFLTRDRVASLGWAAYVAENLALTARVFDLLARPAVRALVHTSSGAALAARDGSGAPASAEPYGLLKWAEELLFQDACARREITCVTCRVWSVSGPDVREPDRYAFSNLIRQAQSGGDIAVASSHRVYRRYVDAGELMEVALRLALAGRSTVFDSGGTYVELGELAELIRAEIGSPGQRVRRGEGAAGAPDDEYAPDGAPFLELAREMGVELSGLERQIRQTAARLAADAAGPERP